MFDLEKALAAWRRSLEYNRSFTGEDVDELESHVRDQVRVLTARGFSEEQAFGTALRQMGGYGAVEDEYQKVYWGKLRRRRRLTTEFTWNIFMLKNDLKVAVRTLRRRKVYTFINIFGLAAGLTFCAFIFLYVRDEVSYDRFHERRIGSFVSMP